MKAAEQIRILVVDDTEQARYATARVLRRAGFTVLEAGTGREGMQKALEHPDLIIMDVKLPDANGIDLSRQLKTSEETRNIPVLQLSATCIAVSDKVRGLEAGADAYLTGPVESDELLATIRVLLRLSYAQETLSRAEQRQRLALQLGRAFSFEWNPATDEVVRSEESGTILGLTGDEISHDTGKVYFERIHPEDRERFRKVLESLTLESNTYRVGYRIVRQDGRIVQIEEAGRAFFDSQGAMSSLIGISQDVTERKRVEEALVESESALRGFFESAPMMCGIIKVCGGDIVHVFDNAATLAHFKIESSEMGRKTATEMGVPAHVVRLWHGKYVECLEQGRPVYFEYLENGRWLGATVAPISSKNASEQRCCYLCQDITDRKNFEGELERKVRERTVSLQETTEQLNDFCYSIAHDLKAPIRGQTAFASMLLSDYGNALDETGREYINRIYDSAVRQGTLVNDLLTHMSLGRSELPLEPVDVSKAIKAVLDEYHREIMEKRAVIHADHVEGTVMADQSSLHLVLSNLLSNALKFVFPDEAPVVRIACRVEGPNCIISVQDNGIGVEPNHMTRIWGVFQRLHTRERYPGTGIGLAIVKKAVERMGGTAGLASEPGKGSTFWVRLPRPA